MGEKQMSEAVKNSIAEYERIRAMFLSGDPDAESAWRKFVTADNGVSICANYIGNC